MARTINTSSANMARSVNAVSANMSRAARMVNNTQRIARQVALAPSPQRLTAAQKETIKDRQEALTKAEERAKSADQPELAILPTATLAKLTEDQRGLQNVAQKEALTANLGEVIFWDFEGSGGAAVAKDEHRIGSFTCRTFEQSITIEGVSEESMPSHAATNRPAIGR